MKTKDFDDIGVAIALGFVVFLAGYAFGIFMCTRHPERFNIVTAYESCVEETTATTVDTTTEITTSSTSTSTTVITSTYETEAFAETTTETTCETQMLYFGSFTATYYNGDTVPCKGGSGRTLVSCYEKETSYKGSIASRYVFEKYGYFVNGKTEVYIEFPSYERLNGWYSVDDCNADPSIVDFYFADYSTCPWQFDGVTTCDVWIGV